MARDSQPAYLVRAFHLIRSLSFASSEFADGTEMFWASASCCCSIGRKGEDEVEDEDEDEDEGMSLRLLRLSRPILLQWLGTALQV